MKLRLKLCGTSAPPLFLELYEDNLLSITVIFSNFKKITCRVPAISWCRSSDLFPLQLLFAKKFALYNLPGLLTSYLFPPPSGFLEDLWKEIAEKLKPLVPVGGESKLCMGSGNVGLTLAFPILVNGLWTAILFVLKWTVLLVSANASVGASASSS